MRNLFVAILHRIERLTLPRRFSLRLRCPVEARPKDFSGYDSDNGNREFEPAGEKMSKNPHVLDTGGHDVTIVTVGEPGSSSGST